MFLHRAERIRPESGGYISSRAGKKTITKTELRSLIAAQICLEHRRARRVQSSISAVAEPFCRRLRLQILLVAVPECRSAVWILRGVCLLSDSYTFSSHDRNSTKINTSTVQVLPHKRLTSSLRSLSTSEDWKAGSGDSYITDCGDSPPWRGRRILRLRPMGFWRRGRDRSRDGPDDSFAGVFAWVLSISRR